MLCRISSVRVSPSTRGHLARTDDEGPLAVSRGGGRSQGRRGPVRRVRNLCGGALSPDRPSAASRGRRIPLAGKPPAPVFDCRSKLPFHQYSVGHNLAEPGEEASDCLGGSLRPRGNSQCVLAPQPASDVDGIPHARDGEDIPLVGGVPAEFNFFHPDLSFSPDASMALNTKSTGEVTGAATPVQ